MGGRPISQLKDQAIILTGGAGFIGSAFLWKLNQLGETNILVVDHDDSPVKMENLKHLSYVDYQEKDVITGKKFVTKLLNATRFVFMNLKDYKPKKTKLFETDRLFLSNLNKLIKNCTANFENYEYSSFSAAGICRWNG